jgi:hypothetical protein
MARWPSPSSAAARRPSPRSGGAVSYPCRRRGDDYTLAAARQAPLFCNWTDYSDVRALWFLSLCPVGSFENWTRAARPFVSVVLACRPRWGARWRHDENGKQSEGVLAIHDGAAWSISAHGLAVRAPGAQVEEDCESNQRASRILAFHDGATEATLCLVNLNARQTERGLATARWRKHLAWCPGQSQFLL